MGKQAHHVKRRAKLRLSIALPACETVQHSEAVERRVGKVADCATARIFSTRVATAQPQHRKHVGCTNGPSSTKQITPTSSVQAALFKRTGLPGSWWAL